MGVTVRRPLVVANCSGFYGDRLAAARQMIDGGPIDVLTGDWLAELTMTILARSRQRWSGSGYARTFVSQVEHVRRDCLDRGMRIVSNAGGLDPGGCADAVAAAAERVGLHPTIAAVDGDDLSARLDALVKSGHRFADLDTGEPLGSRRLDAVAINAYLGMWGIVEALTADADIVITGRVTDAALVAGPAAWHHGWRHESWMRSRSRRSQIAARPVTRSGCHSVVWSGIVPATRAATPTSDSSFGLRRRIRGRRIRACATS